MPVFDTPLCLGLRIRKNRKNFFPEFTPCKHPQVHTFFTFSGLALTLRPFRAAFWGFVGVCPCKAFKRRFSGFLYKVVYLYT